MGIFKSGYKNSGIFEVGLKLWLGVKRVTKLSVTSVCFLRKKRNGKGIILQLHVWKFLLPPPLIYSLASYTILTWILLKKHFGGVFYHILASNPAEEIGGWIYHSFLLCDMNFFMMIFRFFLILCISFMKFSYHFISFMKFHTNVSRWVFCHSQD